MGNKSSILLVALPVMVVLLCVAVYEYGYLIVQAEINGLEDAVSTKAKTLAKYKSLIAQNPRIEENLIAMREMRKTAGTKTIEGQTPSIAAASLQDMVKGMVTARGGSIVNERAEKPEGSGEFITITVTIEAVLPDTKTLADTLYAIETQSPYTCCPGVGHKDQGLQRPKGFEGQT